MLRLATLNLLHGVSTQDGACDPARLKAGVHEVDADVLALQEVDCSQPRSERADQTALAAAAAGARWRAFVPTVVGTPGVRGWRGWTEADGEDVWTRPTEGPTYGISLVSRLPVRRWQVTRFRAAPGRLPLLVPSRGRGGMGVGFVPDEPRAALAAVVEGPHGPFTVVTTHLSFVPGFNVRQLRAVVRWTQGLPRPLVLLGDLNLPGGLPGRISRWRPLSTAATYPAASPRAQLDHVLADGLRDGAVRSDHVWTLPVSDHCALGVDVDL
jgi:endonuclease/exonuclease/phosphatase family metal-dependent hydrolase